ncbi:MAG: hypothetical protein Q9182_000113, partial [Xanthomendoza sp. 2 TL-2023]
MSPTILSTEKPAFTDPSIHPVTGPNPPNPNLPTQQSPPPTTTPTDTEPYDPTSTNPFSPFYSHARASESKSRLHTRSSTADYDLEKGFPANTTTNTNTNITIHPVPSTQSVVAPAHIQDPQQQPQRIPKKCGGKQSLLCKSEAKNAHGWWWRRKLSSRQRMCVRVLVAVVFIGAVTGLGVGVSKAMGTGVWKGANS